MKATYILVTSEMRIYSYKRYGYRKVAQKHADKINAYGGNCQLSVMSMDEYRAATEDKTRLVRNAMTGQMQEEAMNTPYSCSVSSESYWSN